MTEARVTNNTDTPLLVGGVSIEPGRTVKIRNWHQHAGSDKVVAWIAAKAITIDEVKEAAKAEPAPKKPAKKAEIEDALRNADGG